MASLTYRSSGRTVTDRAEVETALRAIGVHYECWGVDRLPAALRSRNLDDAEKQAVLAAFAPEIARANAAHGYKTADVVTLYPDTPNLDAMLAKFDKQHIHTDDEVRLVIQGRGVFTLFPDGGEVVDAELHPGDFIVVPARYPHLFTLADDRRITAVRLFIDPAGWVAHYTDAGSAASAPAASPAPQASATASR